MGMTQEQDIPNKPQEKQEWTFRHLFPFAAAASVLSKVFLNPFDILLGYLVIVLGLAELIGRHVSWFLWVLTILILLADLFERHSGILSDSKKPEEKK